MRAVATVARYARQPGINSRGEREHLLPSCRSSIPAAAGPGAFRGGMPPTLVVPVSRILAHGTPPTARVPLTAAVAKPAARGARSRRRSAPSSPPAKAHGFAGRALFATLDSDAVLYGALLLVVWGLTVPMRGLWQDDTLLLRLAREFQGRGFLAAFTPIVTPMRRLYTLPFRLALETAQPIWTLHLLFGLVWLSEGLCAGWIARLLVREQRLAPWLATCLTLTATSDFLTDNLTGLGYNLAALAVLLAFACALRYLNGGSAAWVALSCVALAVSIWTLDLAIPALPFLPVLLFWRGRAPGWRRSVLVLLALGATLAPAVPVEWQFLHDSKGYAAVAMQPMAPSERIVRTAALWLDNFEPWHWVFARSTWYPRPAAVIPSWTVGLAVAGAASWFAFRARRLVPGPAKEGGARTLGLVGVFALMALASNAAYAGVQMAETRYRTHILSRVFASLAIAILVGWAVQRWPRRKTLLLLVPTLFVGFGVWGGLERQDLWVSTWRLHEKELLSIVENAPALAPGTGLILRSGPTPYRYLATEADYLSQSWMVLLYDQPGIQSLRLAPDRGTGCHAVADGLECWHENEADCFASRTCAADRYPYGALVVMDFDERDGRYHLVSSLAGDALLQGSDASPAAYRPAERILKRPLTARQRALLLQ